MREIKIGEIGTSRSTWNIVWSPNSSKLLYNGVGRIRGNLWLLSVKEGSPTIIKRAITREWIDGESREVANTYQHLNFLSCNNKILFKHFSSYSVFVPHPQSIVISHGDLTIMNIDGSNKRILIPNRRIQNLILLPSDKILFQPFFLYSHDYRTYILDIKSKIKRELGIRRKAQSFSTSFDRRRVAYLIKKDHLDYDLYVMNLNDQSYRLIKNFSQPLHGLQFSYCNQKLIYSFDWGVYTINIDGTGKRRIAEGRLF